MMGQGRGVPDRTSGAPRYLCFFGRPPWPGRDACHLSRVDLSQ